MVCAIYFLDLCTSGSHDDTSSLRYNDITARTLVPDLGVCVTVKTVRISKEELM